MRHRRLGRLAVALLGSAHVALAQPGAPGTAPSDQHDCKRAAQIVAKGKPDKKESWAFLTVAAYCNADVSGTAAASIRLMRTEADTSVLFETWAHFTRVSDPGIMAAYLDVLVDRGASAVARAWSAGALFSMENGGIRSVGYGQLVGGGAECEVSYIPSLRSREIAPLASGHRETVRAALSSVAEAADSPAIVRSAARCTLTHLRPGQ